MSDPGQRATRVLLVDPDPQRQEELRAGLARAREGRFVVEGVGELSLALQRLSKGGVDLLLLDLILPDSEGVVTFERAYAFAPDVPIVVFTDLEDERAALSAVQGGAQDYLVKSTTDPISVARAVRYAIERHRLLAALRSLSLIDELTGLYNRRGFAQLGEQHLKLARRTGRAVTLVFMDLDRFKTINDTLGHHVGDRGLNKIAEILRSTFRRSDIVARMGGDEFAVLALEASGEDAAMLVERLREHIETFNLSGREPFRLSVSVGIARYDETARTGLAELLAEADVLMYEEKRRKEEELERLGEVTSLEDHE
ncbi:MAG: diguanylate cyclase [Gemmatimonadota bacterium]